MLLQFAAQYIGQLTDIEVRRVFLAPVRPSVLWHFQGILAHDAGYLVGHQADVR
jgi:hypothetical protein